MFKNIDDRSQKAEMISEWLAGHENFKSHARHIPRIEVENRELIVLRLEADQRFQDLVLSVFHSTTHTFTGTPSVKIVENHDGRAFIKQHTAQAIPAVQVGVTPPIAGPSP